MMVMICSRRKKSKRERERERERETDSCVRERKEGNIAVNDLWSCSSNHVYCIGDDDSSPAVNIFSGLT
jgi:hypothetical protein